MCVPLMLTAWGQVLSSGKEGGGTCRDRCQSTPWQLGSLDSTEMSRLAVCCCGCTFVASAALCLLWVVMLIAAAAAGMVWCQRAVGMVLSGLSVVRQFRCTGSDMDTPL